MSTSTEYSNICANIRYLRAREGLSRTAMARRLHITLKTLDTLESGVFPDRCGIGLLMHACAAFHSAPASSSPPAWILLHSTLIA